MVFKSSRSAKAARQRRVSFGPTFVPSDPAALQSLFGPLFLDRRGQPTSFSNQDSDPGWMETNYSQAPEPLELSPPPMPIDGDVVSTPDSEPRVESDSAPAPAQAPATRGRRRPEPDTSSMCAEDEVRPRDPTSSHKKKGARLGVASTSPNHSIIESRRTGNRRSRCKVQNYVPHNLVSNKIQGGEVSFIISTTQCCKIVRNESNAES